MAFRGTYYSGDNSASQPIEADVNSSGYLVFTEGDLAPVHFRDLEISSRVGNSSRYLKLPSGGRIETRDNDAIDALVSRWHSSQSGLVHRLEKNRRSIGLATVLLFLGLYGFVTVGVPALSGIITAALPVSLDDMMGEQVLEQLDELIFEPTTLAPQRRQALQQQFARLVPATEREFRLEFRSSQVMGANAFALPDARIVFTDQLVELSDDDEMMAAIMLHEIGHVAERHAMQGVVRQAGLSMLVFALTGDVNGAATALIILLPNFLIQSSYSRSLEWEADTYALEQMQARRMDTGKFADIMERMVRAAESDEESGRLDGEAASAESDRSTFADYFSSHPATRDRIERFRNPQ